MDLLQSEPWKALVDMLLESGQEHLFSGDEWTQASDDDQLRLLTQLSSLNKQLPGGLKRYIQTGKQLLLDSMKGVNPLQGWSVSVADGETLDPEQQAAEFKDLEQIGLENFIDTAFVLVAGGLGERLGYPGIKVAITVTLASEQCFLEHFCDCILALQRKSIEIRGCSPDRKVPLMIMTSDDTHTATVELLEKHDYFGMERDQTRILKQDKVPCFIDSEGRLSLEADDRFQLETKPHGHGDVHTLLYSSGLAQSWQEQGTKWVVFFQDTSALVFNSVLVTLGLSVKNNFAMNSVAIPRKPKEAIGGIGRLKHCDGQELTVNIEYNQLDPLLASSGGDVANAKGLSPFPGNINALVLGMDSYGRALKKTHGAVSEFINPKYTDQTKSKLSSSARLESMMQSLPYSLSSETDRVGFSELPRWLVFTTVKNKLVEGIHKAAMGLPAETAASAEEDIFVANRRILRGLGCNIEDGPKEDLMNLVLFPMISLSPSTALPISQLSTHFPEPQNVYISGKSVLVVKGSVTIEKLHLDGALVIDAPVGTHVVIKNLTVKNQSWQITSPSPSVPPSIAIRGFDLIKHDTRVIQCTDATAVVVVDE